MNYFLFWFANHVVRKLIASDLRRNGRQQHQFMFIYMYILMYVYEQIGIQVCIDN